MTLQRDAFITVVHEAARKDDRIVFLSADLGAETLDVFRAELPGQFIHCGISEQHMIDLAAGLSLAGKTVFVYCMGPFLSLRCLEQIKCCLAMMDRPVTLISAGVGLGYADSGPTHYATEDLACLRAISGMEVWTPADSLAATEMARESLRSPGLRYIRLDREAMPDIYVGKQVARSAVEKGFHELWSGGAVCILSSGYMLHRAIAARLRLQRRGRDVGVVDLFQIEPINKKLAKTISRYKALVTVEEQCLPGGFGSAVLEYLSDRGLSIPITRIGLPGRYYFENGGRAHLLDSFGLSVEQICETVEDV